MIDTLARPTAPKRNLPQINPVYFVLTALIVAIILYSIGTGPIKGFAVTTSIGIVTSMFTAIWISRAIVNYIYGGKDVKYISIGMKMPESAKA